MVTGFHLPHNAILPDEVKFIIDLLDINREFYLYDELKALMFEEEIKQGKFEIFHPGMYSNFMNNDFFRELYFKIKEGELKYSDVKNIQYTRSKSLNGCWNEQARDYFEFFAFTGLLPSYYKGMVIENEKRHYIGDTLIKYKKGVYNYQDILFKMKFRNASKNYDNFEQYDIKNRPFVVAIRVMDILKKKGYQEIDGDSLSYIVRNLKDEDLLFNNGYVADLKPIDFTRFTISERKEIARGTTFLKRHLVEGLNISLKKGIRTIFDLTDFDINNYNFKDKSLFIGEIYAGYFEVTPLFLKLIESPQQINDKELKDRLIIFNIIDENGPLYDYNIDTDLLDRNLVEQYKNGKIVDNICYSERIETTDLFRRGKEISESGNGTLYEEFLFDLLKDKFGEERVKFLGSNTMAQRLSDIVCDLTLSNDGITTELRIIVDAKSGSAIKSFDERKEIDDIRNTLNDRRFRKKIDGIWYMVVDSDKIPQFDGHGGFRENNNQLDFKRKLLKIESTIMPETQKLTMVTAFSYVEFMKFIDSIEYDKNVDYLSKFYAPDFWTWSNKFVETSFVTIRA